MKYWFNLFVLTISMLYGNDKVYKYELTIKPKESSEYLKVFLENNQDKQISREASKKKIENELFLASKLLSKLDDTSKKKLDLEIINFLATKEANAYLASKNFENEEEVLKSYYVANKEKYKKPITIDFYRLMFDTKKEAEDFIKEFSKDSKLIEQDKFKEKLKIYKFIPYEQVNDFIKLHVDTHKPKELSKIVTENDKFILFFYDNLNKEPYYPFESVKEQIKSYIIAKKRGEFIDEYVEAIKNEKLK